ncbi:MAG: hypothetical protein R3C68_13555 [Myxococcota bacterium]
MHQERVERLTEGRERGNAFYDAKTGLIVFRATALKTDSVTLQTLRPVIEEILHAKRREIPTASWMEIVREVTAHKEWPQALKDYLAQHPYLRRYFEASQVPEAIKSLVVEELLIDANINDTAHRWMLDLASVKARGLHEPPIDMSGWSQQELAAAAANPDAVVNKALKGRAAAHGRDVVFNTAAKVEAPSVKALPATGTYNRAVYDEVRKLQASNSRLEHQTPEDVIANIGEKALLERIAEDKTLIGPVENLSEMFTPEALETLTPWLVRAELDHYHAPGVFKDMSAYVLLAKAIEAYRRKRNREAPTANKDYRLTPRDIRLELGLVEEVRLDLAVNEFKAAGVTKLAQLLEKLEVQRLTPELCASLTRLAKALHELSEHMAWPEAQKEAVASRLRQLLDSKDFNAANAAQRTEQMTIVIEAYFKTSERSTRIAALAPEVFEIVLDANRPITELMAIIEQARTDPKYCDSINALGAEQKGWRLILSADVPRYRLAQIEAIARNTMPEVSQQLTLRQELLGKFVEMTAQGHKAAAINEAMGEIVVDSLKAHGERFKELYTLLPTQSGPLLEFVQTADIPLLRQHAELLPMGLTERHLPVISLALRLVKMQIAEAHELREFVAKPAKDAKFYLHRNIGERLAELPPTKIIEILKELYPEEVHTPVAVLDPIVDHMRRTDPNRLKELVSLAVTNLSGTSSRRLQQVIENSAD